MHTSSQRSTQKRPLRRSVPDAIVPPASVTMMTMTMAMVRQRLERHGVELAVQALALVLVRMNQVAAVLDRGSATPRQPWPSSFACSASLGCQSERGASQNPSARTPPIGENRDEGGGQKGDAHEPSLSLSAESGQAYRRNLTPR